MLGRSLIALGQLSIILFTPIQYLRDNVAGNNIENMCGSFPSFWNYFCAESLSDTALTVISISILVFIISGYFPFIGGVVHFYYSVAFYSGITLADGGESVAIVSTFWIMIASLSDRRINGWVISNLEKEQKYSLINPVSITASVFLRVQCSLIYLHAAISKLSSDTWVDGTAFYYVVRMEMFGVSEPFRDVILSITATPMGTLIFTHGTIILELFIAVGIWGNQIIKKISVGSSIVLHVGIILILGISSFAIVMIGLVVSATYLYVYLKESLAGSGARYGSKIHSSV